MDNEKRVVDLARAYNISHSTISKMGVLWLAAGSLHTGHLKCRGRGCHIASAKWSRPISPSYRWLGKSPLPSPLTSSMVSLP